MAVQECLAKVTQGVDLTAEEAERAMSNLMLGEVHNGLVGGFLAAMELKGVTGIELAAFVKELREHAVEYRFDELNLVDTCGTGGGSPTFNLSTGAAILAAAAGAKIAKHGNRGLSSPCGSADVLEALGVPISGTLEEQKRRLDEYGLAFLFAPNHHPAIRHVAPVRKALGIRTFFNLLGPLANPAGARRQLIGVYDERKLDTVADALLELGVDHAFVVRGEDGMDEISPCATTAYIEVKQGTHTSGSWSPEDFGIEPAHPDQLRHGSNVQESADILRESLSGKTSPQSEALLPNTAITLVLAGLADSPKTGADLARAALEDGRAKALLARLASG